MGLVGIRPVELAQPTLLRVCPIVEIVQRAPGICVRPQTLPQREQIVFQRLGQVALRQRSLVGRNEHPLQETRDQHGVVRAQQPPGGVVRSEMVEGVVVEIHAGELPNPSPRDSGTWKARARGKRIESTGGRSNVARPFLGAWRVWTPFSVSSQQRLRRPYLLCPASERAETRASVHLWRPRSSERPAVRRTRLPLPMLTSVASPRSAQTVSWLRRQVYRRGLDIRRLSG